MATKQNHLFGVQDLVATDLGYRFADLAAEYFNRIADLLTASAIRYKTSAANR